MASIGERIRQLRKENKLSQKDLAERLKVASNTVSKWELGTQDPDEENLVKMSELFDVPLVYLGGTSDDRSFPEPTDEEGAAVAEDDENDALKHMVQLYRDLSMEGQGYVRAMVSAVWKKERDEGKLMK